MPAVTIFDAKDVFTPLKTPKTTYIPRTQYDLDEQIRESLEDLQEFIFVFGRSKVGKSVLCRNASKQFDHIFIKGGVIRSVEKFWSELASALRLKIAHSTTNHRGGQIGVEKFLVATFGRATSTTESVHSSIDYLTKNLLKSSPHHIFIEDFHYIPRDVQLEILRGLKDELHHGFCVILISVPDLVGSLLPEIPDLHGRTSTVQIPIWDTSELKEIAITGFAALGLIVDDSTIDRLCSESVGSPQIMQRLCLEVCRSEGHLKTTTTRRRPRKPIDVDAICRKYAKYLGSDIVTAFRGGALHGQAPRARPTKDGPNITIYDGVVEVIRKIPPATAVDVNTLKMHTDRLFETSDAPRPSELAGACDKLARAANQRARMPVVGWNATSRQLYFDDPFTLFTLRWSS